MTPQSARSLRISFALSCLFSAPCRGQDDPLPPRPSIQDFFACPDDDKLVMAVWDPMGDIANEKGPEALNPIQRNVIYVLRASGVVGNGGFQYLLEVRQHEAEETVTALRAIGATKAADGLRRALDVFPDGRPHEDVRQRLRFLAALDPAKKDEFESGESDLYYDSVVHIVADYVRAHPEAFVGLPAPKDVVLPGEFPGASASAREVAIWVQSMGGSLEFDGHVYPHGGRKLVFGHDELPGGDLLIRAMRLPGTRRDIDRVLEQLGGWKGAGEVEVLGLERARYLTPRGLTTLRAFGRLRSLGLFHAAVSDAGLGSLVGCSALEHLSLRSTDVTDDGVASLAELPSLKGLALTWTLVQGRGLRALRGLRSLDLGNPGGVGVIDRDLAFLEDLSQLEQLSITDAPLTARAVEGIGRLKNLQELTLWDNGLSEEALDPLSGHRSIVHLNFQGLRITERGAKVIATMPGIRFLMVGSKDITPGACRLIREAFPGAKLQIPE